MKIRMAQIINQMLMIDLQNDELGVKFLVTKFGKQQKWAYSNYRTRPLDFLQEIFFRIETPAITVFRVERNKPFPKYLSRSWESVDEITQRRISAQEITLGSRASNDANKSKNTNISESTSPERQSSSDIILNEFGSAQQRTTISEGQSERQKQRDVAQQAQFWESVRGQRIPRLRPESVYNNIRKRSGIPRYDLYSSPKSAEAPISQLCIFASLHSRKSKTYNCNCKISDTTTARTFEKPEITVGRTLRDIHNRATGGNSFQPQVLFN